MAAHSVSLLMICFLIFGLSLADFPYKEGKYVQYVDHFDLMSYKDETFEQRYLYQDKSWGGDGSPIFFYCGNEGAIEGFWDATGFVHEIAPEFDAYVVFVEHRYYGNSLPFGDSSFDQPKLGLLSVAQAIADYAQFIVDFKENLNAPNSRVIAFGGSYGGMLAAYLRYQHPNIVYGALAASAPMSMQDPDGPHDFFFKAVTDDFTNINKKCSDTVKLAFAQQVAYAQQGQSGVDVVSKKLRLCDKMETAEDFTLMQFWARNAFVYFAMLDYPYPTDFIGPVPGNPVQVACDTMVGDPDPIVALADTLGIWYNASGTEQCYNVSEEFYYCADPTGCGVGPDAIAWNYQACADIYLPNGSDNQTDMFPVLEWNEDLKKDYCNKTFGIIPRVSWDAVQFFGLDLTGTSNIIFSNGDLDPWRNGGITKDVSDSIKAITVKGGAHHLDLRAANQLDPPGVVEARELERSIIRDWINTI